jgi:hypothetical protein
MIEEYPIGSLLIRQRELSADDLTGKSYDLVIASLSWESRGTFCLSHISDRTETLTLLKFASRSPEMADAKARQLALYQKKFKFIEVKELAASTDASNNFPIIKNWIQDKYMKCGRPLKILLDITCIPKTYILYLIGLSFGEELVAKIDCLYAPGIYDLLATPHANVASVSGPRALLSEGEWHSRQIPYLEAEDYIATDNDLIVALGGELGLSLPFIERYEPRRLSLLFISESAPADTNPMLPSERSAYLELLAEPNAQRTDIALADAIGVARHAFAFVSNSTARGTTAIAIGAKPHALGLGVAALAQPTMEVVCRTPAAYKAVDVDASGKVFLYEIEDRFDPTSYV